MVTALLGCIELHSSSTKQISRFHTEKIQITYKLDF